MIPKIIHQIWIGPKPAPTKFMDTWRDKNPDFEYDVDEGFGGELKGKDKDEFEKARKENAEVLGYEATGTSDTKKQTLHLSL